MTKEIQQLSAILALEKSKKYEEALAQTQAILREKKIETPTRSLNIELLEQRLRTRLKSTHDKPKDLKPESRPTPDLKEKTNQATWSAIITMWKRQDYLAEQLSAIRAQSIPPEEIIIILNEFHISEPQIREIGGPDIKIIRSDINSLYSRWAVAYIAKGAYISVFDDDVIPGIHWIENAIRACSSYNALIGPSGRIYNKHGAHGYYKLVTPNAENSNSISCSETDIYCDWVCNSYLFKREWVGHALSSLRHKDSLKTFDDIQLATSLYLSGGIRCITPMQPSFDKKLHGSLQHHYGNDSHAIWKTNSDQHFAGRKSYIEELIEGGYIPVQKRDNLYRFHLIVPFGERSTLERCLLTIKGQDYQNFTCTLIDDCNDSKDALDLVKLIGLDKLHIRYIKTTKKAYPLRARELATDMLSANLADVIIHLDGDDWLPYPDVLSRLNSVYRKGKTLATYGNAISIRDKEIKTTSQIKRDGYGNAINGGKTNNFTEYAPYMMSKRWNVAQKNQSAEWFPLRRVGKNELSSGWVDAPWCGMHLRTFQFSKWLELDRKTFTDKTGNYLRIATDAAIFVPIINSCEYDSIVFIDDVCYVYQDANNTIHGKNEISENERSESLAITARHKNNASKDRLTTHLRLLDASVAPPYDSTIVFENRSQTDLLANQSRVKLPGKPSSKTAAATIVTPNFLADGILCLSSYVTNLRDECEVYLYITTDSKAEISACQRILAGTGVNAVFPSTLKHTLGHSLALSKKYKLNSDEYRWAMKAVILIELIKLDFDSVLFLDPDTYTVSDITDIQRKINQHPISVFPHFRTPDNDYLRGVLYKDGFFNGGMLGATTAGLEHLNRLYERCLEELTKDPARNRWDDQKYFDIFTLEVNDLFVNLDRGIDYNPWNHEPVEGLVSPSQRSVLLGSGFFVRHWHVSTMLIKNAIDLKQDKYSVFRPLISVYLTSLLYIIHFLLVKSKDEHFSADEDFLGLKIRFINITEKLIQLSPAIPVAEFKLLLGELESSRNDDCNKLLSSCATSISNSICFDNYGLFADILLRLFPNNQVARDLADELRNNDLRYFTEHVVASADLSSAKIREKTENMNAGELIKRRLRALQSWNITH